MPESQKDIFERDRSGEGVSMSDPEFYKIYDVIHETMAKLQKMNTSVTTPEEVRAVIADITGTEPDDTLTLFPRSIWTLAGTCASGRTSSSSSAARSWTAAESPSATARSSPPR